MRLTLISAVLFSNWMAPAFADCACEEQDFATVANGADQIVAGIVTRAELDGDLVRASIEVRQVLRGPEVRQVRIKTRSLPGCGVRVVVGSGGFFFLREDKPIIDRCTGVGAAFHGKVRGFRHALLLATYPGGNPGEIIRSVSHAFHEARTEERIVEFLQTVSKLEPHGTEPTRIDAGYLYRDIEIHIEDGVFAHAQPYVP